MVSTAGLVATFVIFQSVEAGIAAAASAAPSRPILKNFKIMFSFQDFLENSFKIIPHPLCWGCKILVLSRLPLLPRQPCHTRDSKATSALRAGPSPEQSVCRSLLHKK